MTAQLMPCRVVAVAPRKPWLLPYTSVLSYEYTVAPSELGISASTTRPRAAGAGGPGGRAEPLCLPKNRVSARPLSRLCSTVSTSPRRTVTDSPWFTLTLASALDAPWRLASARTSPPADLSCSLLGGVLFVAREEIIMVVVMKPMNKKFSPQRREGAKIFPVYYSALFCAPLRLCGK